MKNKMNVSSGLVIFWVALLFIIMGCPPIPPNTDNEFITTVNITLTDVATGGSVSATWEDADGTGGKAPTISSDVRLAPNKTYNGTVEIKNLLASTEEKKDVTPEISAEKDAHQFFYDAMTADGKEATGVTITKTDKDNNNLPVGLSFRLTTLGSSDVSTLRVRLVHYGASAKTEGVIPATADVDVDVEFKVQVR